MGGDNTANIAIDAIIAVGRKARIPVFTTNIGSAERGALFDLGADYAQVGRLIGELGAQILHGTDPMTIPIRDVVPEQVMVNLRALPSLKDRWVVPNALLARADIVIDATAEPTGTRSQVGGNKSRFPPRIATELSPGVWRREERLACRRTVSCLLTNLVFLTTASEKPLDDIARPPAEFYGRRRGR